MARLRPNAAGEEGIAMVIAIATMAVISLLAAAVLVSGKSLSDRSNQDLRDKRALAAARAGLEVARYRLARELPADAMCLTDRPAALGSGGAPAGQCPTFSGDLGNGSTYSYVVSPIITSSTTCGGTTVPATTAKFGWRCLTSTGTYGGRSRRMQQALRTTLGASLFPINGVVGLDSIKINENGYGDIVGPIGSNGKVEVKSCKNGVSQTTWDPGPLATWKTDCSGTLTTASPARTSDYTLDSLDPVITGTETTNDNVAATTGQAAVSYTPANRALTDNGGTWTIDGVNPRVGSGGVWVLNLCSLTFTHVTSLRLLNNAVVKIIIDSSTRTGSGCTGGNQLTMTNVSSINYTAGSPPTPGASDALQLLVYGAATIAITNTSGISAALFAPNAAATFTNQTTWVGGIATKSIDATNGLAFSAADLSNVVKPVRQRFVKSGAATVECTPPSASASNTAC